jgi:mono/diheme cytochrome c family protein
MHADSDEAAHNLGTHKLLPTLSVRGLLGTAPYLRDGSFARIGDLEHVAQTLYRGYLRRVPGRAQTLEAFVSAMPRRANPHPAAARDPARERRGMQAFARAACGTCHVPPAFSSLGQQLLRNVFPERGKRALDEDVLDTPSLLSLAANAPYLSDGSARTLEDAVFKGNRSNRHGDTARLTRSERDDLIAFLESL